MKTNNMPTCGRLLHAGALAAIVVVVAAVPGVTASSSISGQETAVTKINVPSLPSLSSEMRLLHSFPTEKDEGNDVFLTQAHYFSADSNGRIYISDVKAGRVFVFEKDGRFVTKIGRPGQGPGEFNLVGRPLPTSRGLAVLDRSNSRIQYFDDRGRFAGSLRLTKSCGDMAIGTDGTAFVLSMPNVSGEMISAINTDGKIKATFGLPPQALLSNTSIRVCWPKMGPGDELFIAYWFLPFVQVYSSAGELRSVFEFQYRPIQERLAKNEAHAKVAPGGGRAIGEAVIEAIDVDENGFYILYRGKRTEILEFKHDGTFVRTYWTAQAPDYYPRGLLVLNDGGQKAFYLLQVAPENKIDVFIEK